MGVPEWRTRKGRGSGTESEWEGVLDVSVAFPFA